MNENAMILTYKNCKVPQDIKTANISVAISFLEYARRVGNILHCDSEMLSTESSFVQIAEASSNHRPDHQHRRKIRHHAAKLSCQ